VDGPAGRHLEWPIILLWWYIPCRALGYDHDVSFVIQYRLLAFLFLLNAPQTFPNEPVTGCRGSRSAVTSLPFGRRALDERTIQIRGHFLDFFRGARRVDAITICRMKSGKRREGEGNRRDLIFATPFLVPAFRASLRSIPVDLASPMSRHAA